MTDPGPNNQKKERKKERTQLTKLEVNKEAFEHKIKILKIL